MRWRPGGGCVPRTTADRLAEQKRCHAGPRILFDRPGPGTPTPHFVRFLLGPATRWRRVQRRWGDGWGRNFSTVARRQVLTLKRRRSEREMRRRPGGGCVSRTTADTLAEQNRCHAGPRILFDRPRPGTPTHTSFHFPFGPATRWRRVQSRGAMRAGKLFKPGPTRRCGR
jgi:hypothetical protein